MIRTVKPRRGLQRTLSTGTQLRVFPASSEEGSNAWCAELEDIEGEKMRFGLSHEAFQAFVQMVSIIYAKEAGIEVQPDR